MSHHRTTLEGLLAGGDLRSVGRADQAVQELLSGQWQSEQFLEFIESASGVIRMRAADTLEKASRTSPHLIEGFGGRLLALLASTQPKEVRWHLLQMASRIEWPRSQHERLLATIESGFNDKSAIVQVSALQALAELAPQGGMFKAAFRSRLQSAEHSALPSLRARASKLAKRNVA
jgi:hypothetical protein